MEFIILIIQSYCSFCISKLNLSNSKINCNFGNFCDSTVNGGGDYSGNNWEKIRPVVVLPANIPYADIENLIGSNIKNNKKE